MSSQCSPCPWIRPQLGSLALITLRSTIDISMTPTSVHYNGNARISVNDILDEFAHLII